MLANENQPGARRRTGRTNGIFSTTRVMEVTEFERKLTVVEYLKLNGVPGEVRTPDPWFRSSERDSAPFFENL